MEEELELGLHCDGDGVAGGERILVEPADCLGQKIWLVVRERGGDSEVVEIAGGMVDGLLAALGDELAAVERGKHEKWKEIILRERDGKLREAEDRVREAESALAEARLRYEGPEEGENETDLQEGGDGMNVSDN